MTDDDFGEICGNSNRQGKPKYSEQTFPSAPLSTTNPTWFYPGSNAGSAVGSRRVWLWHGLWDGGIPWIILNLSHFTSGERDPCSHWVGPKGCIALQGIESQFRSYPDSRSSWQVACVLLVSGLVHSTVLKIEVTRYSATSADFYCTTRSHKLQARTLPTRRRPERQIQRMFFYLDNFEILQSELSALCGPYPL
jgi:hypothetical protein